jgi:glycosyltransferase involved in cell wall biosynthesis
MLSDGPVGVNETGDNRPMRLAWFTPLRPVTSGIADYSADVLPAIGASHAVDVFVASAAERSWHAPAGVRVLDAHEFPWRTHRAPYDLAVYQVGNAWCHDYMWPYVFRHPGLVVLHDAQLHHARAWSLLRRRRQDDYRAEFQFSHPGAPAAAAEVGLAGYSGPVYYGWPMVRPVVTSARAVAVHNGTVAHDLAATYPDVPVTEIHLGVTDSLLLPQPACQDGAALEARRRELGASVRARHGLGADARVVAAYGGVNPEKRIDALLGAAAAVRPGRDDLRLLLVGQQAKHYDVLARARALGLEDRVTLTGFVPDEELPGYLGAADVAVCLRWPTARETSGAWLRCASAGLPTVITDLSHQPHLASLDPRSWTVIHASPTLEAPAPVAVSIDILDEDHSLRLALSRLLDDAELRRRLGTNARAYWAGRHTVDHMAEGYGRALELAAARPVPRVDLPAHLRPDPWAHARALVEPLGVELPGESS